MLAAALRKVGTGDQKAFEDLYHRTSAKLFGVCLRILPGRPEAEEALQEAFLTIWNKASSFDSERGTAMTWLITVTRNRALDRLRSSGRLSLEPVAFVDRPDEPPLADALMEHAEQQSRMVICLDQLSGSDAALIRAGFLEGSTYSMLATRTGMPLPTVKSRIRRALLKLRACLQ